MLPVGQQGQDTCPGLASWCCLSTPPFSVMLFNLYYWKSPRWFILMHSKDGGQLQGHGLSCPLAPLHM